MTQHSLRKADIFWQALFLVQIVILFPCFFMENLSFTVIFHDPFITFDEHAVKSEMLVSSDTNNFLPFFFKHAISIFLKM